MALSIKNREVEQLARELAAKTNESITDAVLIALRERMERHGSDRERARRRERLLEIGREAAKLPVLDTRTEDEILGYDEHGLPT